MLDQGRVERLEIQHVRDPELRPDIASEVPDLEQAGRLTGEHGQRPSALWMVLQIAPNYGHLPAERPTVGRRVRTLALLFEVFEQGLMEGLVKRGACRQV